MALPAQLTSALGRSLGSEAMRGIVLLAAALAGLILANSPEDGAYRDVFGHMLTFDLGLVRLSDDLRHWINDGLMTLFFYAVALEVKREVLIRELAGLVRSA